MFRWQAVGGRSTLGAMAFGISFQRTFKHRPWIDAVDRVAAAGDNGFNVRFQMLEADLDTIGSRFAAVSTALDSLVAVGGAARSVAIAPLLTTVGSVGWDHSTPGEARKGATAEVAKGAVPVSLPAGGTITRFHAFGTCSGVGRLKLDLVRRNLAGGGEVKVVQLVAQPSGSFTLEKAPDPANAVVDAKAGYFILAQTDGAATGDTMALTGFKVTYTEPA